MCVWVSVEVAVEQRLERGSWGDGLGEALLSRLAVLQGPVPHRGQRGVARIGGRVRMQHVSPAVDRGVGLSEVLRTGQAGLDQTPADKYKTDPDTTQKSPALRTWERLHLSR